MEMIYLALKEARFLTLINYQLRHHLASPATIQEKSPYACDNAQVFLGQPIIELFPNQRLKALTLTRGAMSPAGRSK